MNISAKDDKSGKAEKITITNDKSRLSEEDIKKMVDEAEEMKKEDAEKVEKINARNGLEGYLFQIKNMVADDKSGKLKKEDKDKVDAVCDKALSWLDGADKAKKSDFDKKQKEVQKELMPILAKIQGGGMPGGMGGMPGGFPQQQQQLTDNHHDKELQNIFMNGSGGAAPQIPPQTPPQHNQMINPNTRCQSVPVTHQQPINNQAYNPLTPQLHRMTTQQDHTMNAKRNLNFMFETPRNPTQLQNERFLNNTQIPPQNSNHDHLVPSGNTLPGQQLLQQQNGSNQLYDLAFPLNDLSTPEELEDIPSLDNIDSDDLIKSLDKTNGGDGNAWVNDWSNATMPVMNVT